MAQRVNVVLVDDIDGSEAVETVNFGLDGTDYEIDLSEENAAKIRDALAVFVAHGRRLQTRRRSGTQSSGGGRAARGRSRGAAEGEPTAAEIRAWARENGYDVPERGRVSAEVREAFLASH